MSPGATSRPHASSSSSGRAPRANAQTGVPHASASATTRPYGSSQHGVTSAAEASPTTRVSAACVRWPAYSMPGCASRGAISRSK